MAAPFCATRPVKNRCNLWRQTLRLVRDVDNPARLLLSFDYEAAVDATLYVYFFATDTERSRSKKMRTKFTFNSALEPPQSTTHLTSSPDTQQFIQSPPDGRQQCYFPPPPDSSPYPFHATTNTHTSRSACRSNADRTQTTYGDISPSFSSNDSQNLLPNFSLSTPKKA